MDTYIGANGTRFTDDDLERWAQDAEAGFPDATFGASTPGRPVSVGQDARPVTIRLDAARRAKLMALAAQQHTNVSQVLRNMIDAL
ncbi:CopG family transcriptional regulator [Cellulomonas hominis]|uniref:CopG family transcriptional regulator n=1 Tax=Cellulomonas hominis TaxID=156981 RepID=UPI0014441495|nr:CopG family transcriptional regulator [Cellulomonas hominis]NKY11027.1 CopG family transcriptional regulator [Cellulomonas hominis]